VTKPPVPDHYFSDWPCIPVDTSDGSPFADILRRCMFSADLWTTGPEGPYNVPQTRADASRGQIREALLYLLEMGFIDIDTERMYAHDRVPLMRPKPA
jgi:hypothetical protein